MQAWRSSDAAGRMVIFKAISVTEVLDMAEPLAGFAERLRALRKQKDLSQTELGSAPACTTPTSAASGAAHPGQAATRSSGWPMPST